MSFEDLTKEIEDCDEPEDWDTGKGATNIHFWDLQGFVAAAIAAGKQVLEEDFEDTTEV
jgi:hypothetical protein